MRALRARVMLLKHVEKRQKLSTRQYVAFGNSVIGIDTIKFKKFLPTFSIC